MLPIAKDRTDFGQGDGRYEHLKKSYFTVMYDREGANGLSNNEISYISKYNNNNYVDVQHNWRNVFFLSFQDSNSPKVYVWMMNT